MDEFVLETSQLLHENGYQNVLVSNGLINKKPLEELLPFIQAMNIDVKAFSEDFYRRYCRGRGLKEVLRTVELALPHCHVELTYLIITTLNDSPAEIKSLSAGWPPWTGRYRHTSAAISQLPPDLPYTAENDATGLGNRRRKLSYVYLGNIADTERSSTYCPSCRHLLISRRGYRIKNEGLEGRTCKKCGHTIRLTGHIYGKNDL